VVGAAILEVDRLRRVVAVVVGEESNERVDPVVDAGRPDPVEANTALLVVA
jgi:hypothetical protein